MVHSCRAPPINLRRLRATKYLWTLHLPCHITQVVRASTPMTRMIPPCLHLHHQIPGAPPTLTQLYQTTQDALPPPTPPPVPATLSTPPSPPKTDTNHRSLLSPCNQPGQDVENTQPTRTCRTPQYVEDFVLYQTTLLDPVITRDEAETVAPLGIISCYFMVSFNAFWAPTPSGLCLYPDSFALWTLFLLLLFCPLVWIVFCYFYLPC